MSGPNSKEALAAAIQRIPIIDHHAHPILNVDARGKYRLRSIATEASGPAASALWSSMAGIRAVRQLAAKLSCGEAWEAVESAAEKRIESAGGFRGWARECLQGIDAVLLDDGLDAAGDAVAVADHADLSRKGVARSILRIESLVEDLICAKASTFKTLVPLREQAAEHLAAQKMQLWDDLVAGFKEATHNAIESSDRVAFKSIAGYRGGLDFSLPLDELERLDLEDAFVDMVHRYWDSSQPSRVRLEDPHLVQYFVHLTAQLITASPAPHKPIQFHTGLGDSDITLANASPAGLQPFIKQWPTVPIVLLHAGYPFTRETAYLATMYRNVYADLSLLCPVISQDGQETAISEMLELCPWGKMLWSTDGNRYPEMYILAVAQIREALTNVLWLFVEGGRLNAHQALLLAEDVLWSNANRLYNLDLDYEPLDAGGSSNITEDTPLLRKSSAKHEAVIQDLIKSRGFLQVNWVDFGANVRCRLVPAAWLERQLRESAGSTEPNKFSIGITKACLGLLPNDAIAPGWNPVGEYRLEVDVSAACRGYKSQDYLAYGEFRHEDKAESPLCPRSLLRRVVGNRRFLVGFEVEFVLYETEEARVATRGREHAWSLARPLQKPAIRALLHDMVAVLEDAGIVVEQVHAESGPGQFEVALGRLPPVEAVDTLLRARHIMATAAAEAGFRMTCHPKPDPRAAGTASHVHLSLPGLDGDAGRYQHFYAGILTHLPAILAFTCPTPMSYARLQPGCWAGGQWVAWGRQNRETALRQIADDHWEVKCFDGTANPYLGLAALLAAGVDGLKRQTPLVWGDCSVDPATLDEAGLQALNIDEELPRSLPAALKQLEADNGLSTLLGTSFVGAYLDYKRKEQETEDFKQMYYAMERF